MIERNTSETYIHLINSISSTLDLDSGSYQMQINTSWLGDANDWVITSNNTYNPITHIGVSERVDRWQLALERGLTFHGDGTSIATLNGGCNWNKKLRKNVTPDIPLALQDAQRTISMVRYNANKYGAKQYDIDPNKIGVMGFSAGGNLAVLSSTAFNYRSYDPIDEIDKVSCRPDFAIPVYPGHMTMEHKNKTPVAVAAKELNTDIKISKEIPPTLLIHAKDDPVDPVHYSLVYERELQRTGVNVQLNLYNTGGHAFGVKKQGKETDRWMADALTWLKKIQML
jgi:dienelactone hydrolase